jgi:predicted ATPase
VATILEKLTERERAVTETAEQLHAQVAALTEQLRETEAELHELAVARKVILALGEDEPKPATYPGLPDNPVYQHVLTVLADAETSLRAKDLCRALDTGTSPNHIETMRAKLKRLVATGLVTEDEPGLFAVPRPRTGD